MSGYDAVMLVAFGGPDSMDEVRPFLRRVLAGRPVPEERFEQVAHHYEVIGGKSPLVEITRKQAASLQATLRVAGLDLEVSVGMRHSAPFLSDALRAARDKGARRVLCVIMAAHESPASHGRYRESVEHALRELGTHAPAVGYSAGFHDHPGFIAANVEHVRAAQASSPAARDGLLVFTAHSIPTAVAERSPYVAELRESAALVAAELRAPRHLLAYQSRSGSPREPWLEPDVSRVIEEQAALGTRALLLCPVGFVCDHVEVLYDLDVEAAQTAARAHVAVARAQAVNDHPAFIAALCERVQQACRSH
ncbi:MAG: ferrochelatase [Polyangiales bacterium]